MTSIIVIEQRDVFLVVTLHDVLRRRRSVSESRMSCMVGPQQQMSVECVCLWCMGLKEEEDKRLDMRLFILSFKEKGPDISIWGDAPRQFSIFLADVAFMISEFVEQKTIIINQKLWNMSYINTWLWVCVWLAGMGVSWCSLGVHGWHFKTGLCSLTLRRAAGCFLLHVSYCLVGLVLWLVLHLAWHQLKSAEFLDRTKECRTHPERCRVFLFIPGACYWWWFFIVCMCVAERKENRCI